MKSRRIRALATAGIVGLAAAVMTVGGTGTAVADAFYDEVALDFATKQPFPAVYPGHYPSWARSMELESLGYERGGLVAVYLSRQQTAEFGAGGGIPFAIFAGAANLRVFTGYPVESLRSTAATFPNSCLGIVFSPSRTALVGYVSQAAILESGECPGD